MITFVKSVTKTVANLLSGKKSKRTATVKLPLASGKTMNEGKITEFVEPDEALANALSICGGDPLLVVKWFDHGRISHARVVGSNALLGASDADTRKKIKQFGENVKMLVDVMDMSKEQAIQKLASKAAFAPVVDYFKAIDSGSENVTFDFTEADQTLSTPRWFGGESEDEDEEQESEESNS